LACLQTLIDCHNPAGVLSHITKQHPCHLTAGPPARSVKREAARSPLQRNFQYLTHPHPAASSTPAPARSSHEVAAQTQSKEASDYSWVCIIYRHLAIRAVCVPAMQRVESEMPSAVEQPVAASAGAPPRHWQQGPPDGSTSSHTPSTNPGLDRCGEIHPPTL
jgi:hypothetical protein